MNNSEAKISFRIVGDNLSLSLKPLINQVDGQLVERGYIFPNSGKVNDIDYWTFETPYSKCEDVEKRLIEDLAWILNNDASIEKLLDSSKFELFLDIVLRIDPDNTPAFSLGRDLVKSLGRIGVNIDIDLYSIHTS